MAGAPTPAENRLLCYRMTEFEPTHQESIARLTTPDRPLDDFDAFRAAGWATTDTVARLAE